MSALRLGATDRAPPSRAGAACDLPGVPPKLARLGLALLVVAVMPTLPGYDRYAVPKEGMIAALVLGVALASFRWLGGAGPRLRLDGVDVALGGFALLGAVSAACGQHSFWVAARPLLLSTSAVVLFAAARPTHVARPGGALGAACFAAAVLAAALGLAEAHGLLRGLSASGRAPGGFIGHRNLLSHVLALALPTGIVIACGAAPPSRKRALAGLAVVCAALTLTRSRGGWLAAAGGLTTLLLAAGRLGLFRTGLRGRALKAGLACSLGVAAAMLVPNALHWRSATPYVDTVGGLLNARSGSGRGRLIQYATSLRMARDHPLVGVAPGHWATTYPRYADPRGDPSYVPDSSAAVNRVPSSDWVGGLAERGALGMACMAVAVALMARTWRRLASGSVVDRIAAATGAATLVPLVIAGSVDAVLQLPTGAAFASLILGAVTPRTAATAGTAIASGPTARGRPRARAAVLVRGALVGLAGVHLAYLGLTTAAMLARNAGRPLAWRDRLARAVPGDYELRWQLARSWAAAGRCDYARTHAEAARRLQPYLPALRRSLPCDPDAADEPAGGRRARVASATRHLGRPARPRVAHAPRAAVLRSQVGRERLLYGGGAAMPRSFTIRCRLWLIQCAVRPHVSARGGPFGGTRW